MKEIVKWMRDNGITILSVALIVSSIKTLIIERKAFNAEIKRSTEE